MHSCLSLAQCILQLAVTLVSMLDAPEATLVCVNASNHPSSFCQLLGLTTEELLSVMEGPSFIVKHGKNNAAQFENDAFNSFLWCYPELQFIDGCPSKPSAIKPCKEYWAYLIEQPNDDPWVKSFSSQLSSKALPPNRYESNTIKGMAAPIINQSKAGEMDRLVQPWTSPFI